MEIELNDIVTVAIIVVLSILLVSAIIVFVRYLISINAPIPIFIAFGMYILLAVVVAIMLDRD